MSNSSVQLERSSRPIWVLLLLGLLGLAFLAILARPAAGAPAAAIDGPAQLGFAPMTSTIAVADLLTVAVRIRDIEGLYGTDVRLSFAPAILQVEDADPVAAGVQIQPGYAPRPDFLLRRSADNAAGTIWYAATSVSPTLPFVGEGTVVTVTFRAIAPGISPLRFTYTKLVQRTGAVCDYAVEEGGQVEVWLIGPGGTATPTSTGTALSETPTPTSVPPTETPTPMGTLPTASPTPRVTHTPTPPQSEKPRVYLPLVLHDAAHVSWSP